MAYIGEYVESVFLPVQVRWTTRLYAATRHDLPSCQASTSVYSYAPIL